MMNVLDTIMRVPPLFIMDSVLKFSGDDSPKSPFKIRLFRSM